MQRSGMTAMEANIEAAESSGNEGLASAVLDHVGIDRSSSWVSYVKTLISGERIRTPFH